MKASAVLILIILISGCTGTRSLPYTVIPPEGIKVQSEALSKKWYSEGCSKTGTTIKSAHHGGVAQAEQYWIFGMSVSQKKSMHNSSLVLTAAVSAVSVQQETTGRPI